MINITEKVIKFNDLEEKMWKKKMEEGQNELREQLRKIDDLLLKNKNNDELEAKDFRPTTIKCKFGDIKINRRRYKLKIKETVEWVYLLDVYLELGYSGLYSQSIVEMVVKEATEKSYRKTAETIRETTNVSITHTAARKILIDFAENRIEKVEKEKLKLYEKGSLTATTGGYRLMASQVNNQTAETDGYVVFDLFIKNSSGTEYYDAYNALNEEAIYLTNNSEVKVGSTGVANTGIENSVRVAFAQIGRVEATNRTAETIQGISCNGAIGTQVGDVTSICRTAQIWEPNDTSHVEDALTWYNTTCKARTGANTSLQASYEGTCGTVVDGLAYIAVLLSSINKL